MPKQALEAIISIHPEFAAAILDGRKRVELRRRALRLPPGMRLWIYSTLPVGAFVGYARVEKVISTAPKFLRARLKDACITEQEFDSYFSGAATGSAIVLGGVRKLEVPLSLLSARKIQCGFHPPQTVAYMKNESELLRALVAQLAFKKPLRAAA